MFWRNIKRIKKFMPELSAKYIQFEAENVEIKKELNARLIKKYDNEINY